MRTRIARAVPFRSFLAALNNPSATARARTLHLHRSGLNLLDYPGPRATVADKTDRRGRRMAPSESVGQKGRIRAVTYGGSHDVRTEAGGGPRALRPL
jgi:hypothetical protein